MTLNTPKSSGLTNTPKVYVACLASYNDGVLFGEWIDVDSFLESSIEEMLERSPAGEDAEEWAIHDYDNCPDMGENPDLDELVELVECIEEHGEAYQAYVDLVGSDYATKDGFEESYRGEFDSAEDYAYELVQDCYDLDKLMGNLANYFDYEKFARDLSFDGYSFPDNPNGGVFVFSD